jgi:DNA-binding protein YbaB
MIGGPGSEDRLDQLGQAVEHHADRVVKLRQRAAEFASRAVTGRAAQGQVVVTVTGGGVIQGVRVSQRALQEMDNQTLAGHVRAAVNEALDRVDEHLQDLRPAPPGDVDAALESYERRMDDMLDRLDTIDRALGQLDG